jgi:hypothetical protein
VARVEHHVGLIEDAEDLDFLIPGLFVDDLGRDPPIPSSRNHATFKGPRMRGLRVTMALDTTNQPFPDLNLVVGDCYSTHPGKIVSRDKLDSKVSTSLSVKNLTDRLLGVVDNEARSGRDDRESSATRLTGSLRLNLFRPLLPGVKPEVLFFPLALLGVSFRCRGKSVSGLLEEAFIVRLVVFSHRRGSLYAHRQRCFTQVRDVLAEVMVHPDADPRSAGSSAEPHILANVALMLDRPLNRKPRLREESEHIRAYQRHA